MKFSSVLVLSCLGVNASSFLEMFAEGFPNEAMPKSRCKARVALVTGPKCDCGDALVEAPFELSIA